MGSFRSNCMDYSAKHAPDGIMYVLMSGCPLWRIAYGAEIKGFHQQHEANDVECRPSDHLAMLELRK
jgi:hypothetical protein